MDPGIAAAGAGLSGLAVQGASLAGNLVGGLLNNKATKETNKTNLAIANAQMRFQERMSSTAHQREVSDLRAAGLNPILSGTGGSGASAPSGASATMQAPNYSFVGDALKDSVNTGMAFSQLQANLQTQKAQTAKTVADTMNSLETNKAIRESVAGQQIANARDAGVSPSAIERARAEAALAGNALARSKATFAADVLSAQAGASKSRTDAQVARAELPGIAARSHVAAEQAGTDKLIEQFGGVLSNITNSMNLFNLFRTPTVRPGSSQEYRALDRAGSRGLKVGK